MPEITELLAQMEHDNPRATAELMDRVYNELHRLAAAYMRRERVDHTLQTTAVVHEAYLRLVGQREIAWKNRAHFLGVAAQMMRRILVDHARAHLARQRGGSQQRVSLDEVFAPSGGGLDGHLTVPQHDLGLHRDIAAASPTRPGE